jgi:sec-independent protein translocase protein TatB
MRRTGQAHHRGGMLRSMFGMGGTEILVILIVALLFLGPDKLPEAAKTISKGIRDIKKQSRVFQRTIEDDEHIGGAIRDLRSALRGEDEPYRPPTKPPKELEPGSPAATSEVVSAEPEAPQPDPASGSEVTAVAAVADPGPSDAFEGGHSTHNGTGEAGTLTAAAPALTLPPTAGEPDEDAPLPSAAADAELASLVKPAPNTIAHTPRPVSEPSQSPGRKHG